MLRQILPPMNQTCFDVEHFKRLASYSYLNSVDMDSSFPIMTLEDRASGDEEIKKMEVKLRQLQLEKIAQESAASLAQEKLVN